MMAKLIRSSLLSQCKSEHVWRVQSNSVI
jgi:hypothetical protein